MSSPTELSNKEVVDDQDSSSSCPPSSTSSSSKPDRPVIGEGENTTTTSTTDYPIVFGIQIDEEEIPVTTSREEEQQQSQQLEESNVTNTTIPHQQGRLLLSNTVVDERDRGRRHGRRRRRHRNHNNNDDDEDRQKQNFLWIIFISGGLCLLLIFLLAFLVSSTTSQQEGSYYGGTTPAADYSYDDEEDSYEDSYDDHSYDYDYDDYWSQYGNYDNIDYCGESHSGLIVRGTSNACGFPLRSMKIDALAVGEIVQVIMTQEFQTIPMQVYPVITEYTLPLDEQAAVTSFKAEIDSKIIEGVVKEREQAEEEFQEAVDQGLNAYLGEQIRPDIFHMSVGNLPPGKIVRVTIHYVAPLRSVDSNLMQFILPTDTTPRYDPWHNSQDPIPDGQNLINDGVQITLNVLSYTPTFRIFSNTHQIQVSQDDVFGNVVVVDEDPLEHDLVISIETIEGSSNPAVYVEQSNEHGLAMMLSIVPEHFLSNEIFDDDSDAGQDGTTATTRYEFVFVVDRSGSMSSDQKIVQLKRALLYILGTSLPNDALFNIVGFGSRYDVLFPEGSQPRSSHLAQGLVYVNSIQADMGGTEILSPLQYVLNLPPYGEEEEEEVQHNRIVFLITDGEVSNTDDVIEYVATATADDSAMTTGSSSIFTRVFTLGIGAHASRNLVEGVARAGGGTADFVDGDSDEAITSAVERQMEIALSPIINDVDIDWIFAQEQPNQVVMIEQAPYYPPPLFQQRRFLMYFLAENPPLGTLPLSMVLTANHFGGQQQQSQSQIVSLEVSTDSFVQSPHDSLLIHQMAARELIRDLEEGRSRFHADGDVNPDVLEGQVRDEIVRLGVKYQIASSETSFIAIDNGEVVEGGDVPTDEVTDDEDGGSFTNAPAAPPPSSAAPVFGAAPAPTEPPAEIAPPSSAAPGDGQEMGGSADYEAEGDGVIHGQGYESGAISIFPLLSFINMLVVAAYLLLSW